MKHAAHSHTHIHGHTQRNNIWRYVCVFSIQNDIYFTHLGLTLFSGSPPGVIRDIAGFATHICVTREMGAVFHDAYMRHQAKMSDIVPGRSSPTIVPGWMFSLLWPYIWYHSAGANPFLTHKSWPDSLHAGHSIWWRKGCLLIRGHRSKSVSTPLKKSAIIDIYNARQCTETSFHVPSMQCSSRHTVCVISAYA